MDIYNRTNYLCKFINTKYRQFDKNKQLQNSIIGIKNFVDILNKFIKISHQHSDTELAKILISLDKILDLYSLDDFDQKDQNKILRLVRKIVASSTNIINPNKFNLTIHISYCGNHEDKACEICNPNIGHYQNLKNLPPSVAINFINNTLTYRRMLKSNSNIIRVIGKNNSPFGSYWLINKKPNSKKNWRSQYAVLSAWNDGTHYVELKTTEKFDYWIGQAASQAVPFENCILRGGYLQIWIPPRTMKKLIKNITTTPIPTRW